MNTLREELHLMKKTSHPRRNFHTTGVIQSRLLKSMNIKSIHTAKRITLKQLMKAHHSMQTIIGPMKMNIRLVSLITMKATDIIIHLTKNIYLLKKLYIMRPKQHMKNQIIMCHLIKSICLLGSLYI